MKKSLSTDTEKHGRWLPWAAGTLAFSEILESDSDNDGWTDAEEIIAGTDPANATEPWDSDGDGIADYLEFADGTDPLDPNDPPRARGASVMMNAVAPISDDSSTNILSLPAPTWSSQQNMWHNTAWFGERLNYTFYTPAESSATIVWKVSYDANSDEKVSVNDGVAYENRAFDGYVSRGVIPFIRKTGEDCDVWFKEF